MFDKSLPLSPKTKEDINVKGIADELKRINAEIYERNVELALRNRTLSLLQRIYEVINTSLSVKDTAQKIVDDIVKELSFQIGFIALLDKKKKSLKITAVSCTSTLAESQTCHVDNYFRDKYISLKDTENYCVQTISTGERHMTNFINDLLPHKVDQQEAVNLEKDCKIQTSLLYPIIFGGETLGVIVIGIDKHIGFLSRGEREALKELVDVVSIAIERSQIYMDLKDANKRLKRLDKLKDDFVSIASHELRTPMTAIKSYLWMALNKPPEPLNKEVKNYLDICYTSTERLIHLVNDMLTVSRIERNKIELHFGEGNLYEVIKQVYDELKITADERHIDLTYESPKTGLPLEGDKDKLREVFQNIIGNALKFTPVDGKVNINVELKGNRYYVSIRDTGPGIHKEEMGKLFQKFSRLDYSYTTHANAPGTGLGLYISKQIIALHHGEITVQSEVNKGSTFTVILPVSQPKEKNHGPVES